MTLAGEHPTYYCPRHACELTTSGSELVCPYRHAYAIVGGIPRFVDSNNYAAAFGRQWNRFRLTQLDSHTGVPLTENRILRCLGYDTLHGRDEDLLRDQAVLEVGCGAGRFTEILLKFGAAVTSVDLSDAVVANAASFPPGGRHRVAQADVRALPFPPGQFDGVFCLGVVQHTPDSETTIARLYEQVKPGGWIVFDHYAVSLSTLTWVGMMVAREVIKRLPADRQLPAVERLVTLLLPLHRWAARKGRLPARALSRISPILTYYHLHPELDEELQYEWAVLDTHDALTDVHKHHRRPAQIADHLRRLGLENVVVRKGGNGVEARGQRPAPAVGVGAAAA